MVDPILSPSAGVGPAGAAGRGRSRLRAPSVVRRADLPRPFGREGACDAPSAEPAVRPEADPSRRSAPGQLLEQHLADPVAPAAAHHEHGVAAAGPRRRASVRSPRHVPGAATTIPGWRAATAAREPCGRGDRRVRVAAGPDVGDRRPHRPRRGRPRTPAGARPSGGTSAARTRPRRGGRARAGGRPRASPGSRSGGGRSRRTRRTPPTSPLRSSRRATPANERQPGDDPVRAEPQPGRGRRDAERVRDVVAPRPCGSRTATGRGARRGR